LQIEILASRSAASNGGLRPAEEVEGVGSKLNQHEMYLTHAKIDLDRFVEVRNLEPDDPEAISLEMWCGVAYIYDISLV